MQRPKYFFCIIFFLSVNMIHACVGKKKTYDESPHVILFYYKILHSSIVHMHGGDLRVSFDKNTRHVQLKLSW